MMRNTGSRCILRALILSSLLMCCNCSVSDQWTMPRVVRIRGGEACFNYNHLAWYVGARDAHPAGILARDGDLLITDPTEFGFIYRGTDGESLDLDLQGDVLFLQGNPVSLRLARENTGREWLRNASPLDLFHLRTLWIKGEDSLDFPQLQKLARVRPDIGLFITEIYHPDVVVRLFDLFEPRVLHIQSSVLAARFEEVESGLAKLEVLFLLGDSDDEENLSFLAKLPRLHTLWLQERLSKSAGILAGCRNLRSLTVIDDEITDLSILENVTGLCELVLIGSPNLENISALEAFPDLKKLSLCHCGVRDLSVLERLTGLVWLGFPKDTTQEAFAAAVAGHPALEAVELIGCDNIRDLSPLQSLPNLKAAVILTKGVDLDGLQDLKDLQYLALPKEAFEGDAARKTAALEQALPNTFIAQAAPFCLGSGWILLLVPATVIIWILLVWRKKRRGASDA
ncbi:MAG: hypothetical protein JXL20_10150 [Deltaproteobacteria bacterium]|nr:hypothetical protein [Deltaproteobacteria bacterium]